MQYQQTFESHSVSFSSSFQANRADIVTLDAGEVYSAVKQFGLVVIAKELYSDGKFYAPHRRDVSPPRAWAWPSVYVLQEAAFCRWPWWQTAHWTSAPCGASGAVTVEFDGPPDGVSHWASCCPATTWAGQRSSRCITVIRLQSAVGRWSPTWSPHLFLSPRADVSTFFSASCVPGAAGLAPQLCSLCQGQKSYIRQRNYNCETSHSEPFYNSQGALRWTTSMDLPAYRAQLLYFKHAEPQLQGFELLLLPPLSCNRCLRSGAADVAFVDHLALENIEGSNFYSIILFTVKVRKLWSVLLAEL